MTHGSLFSGIGGIDLGFEWAGIETKWQVEIDDYCQKLLSIRFPHTKKFTDVRKVGSHNLEKVDIISGGFPCQDISVAGKGAGIEGERSGLWTELHRVISELRPRFAFIENVPMLTIRGGTRVIADLAEIGYDAEWQIVGADDVGAWHRRKRIWIVAYPEGNQRFGKLRNSGEKNEKIEKGREKNRGNPQLGSGSEDVPDTRHTEPQGRGETSKRQQSQRRRDARSKPSSLYHDVPDPGSKRLERHRGECELGESGEEIKVSRGGDVPDTTSKRRCSGDTTRKNAKDAWELRRSERFGYWSFEPDVGRVAHGIPKRVDRLKGIGNAVVPHIPYIIGKRLKELCQENQAEKH
jgi:DNA (cytosine-5)-methyltransferase 1